MLLVIRPTCDCLSISFINTHVKLVKIKTKQLNPRNKIMNLILHYIYTFCAHKIKTKDILLFIIYRKIFSYTYSIHPCSKHYFLCHHMYTPLLTILFSSNN